MIGAVSPLDQEALIRILVEPKNALVKQYQKFFELEDVELEFTDDALEAVADQALLRGTGARGLRAILEEVLLNVMYDLPSRTDVEKCVIDREVVLEKVNPTLVPRGEAPRQQRPPSSGVLNLPEQSLAWLDQHINLEASTAVAGKVEGLKLDNMRELCAVLGDPQHDQPTVHITGTNGKGSVARMVTALLGAHGLSGRHLHEPPPRGDQRAHLPQRRADRRRRAGARCSPTSPASSRCSTARAVVLRAAHRGRVPLVLRRGGRRGRGRGRAARPLGRHQRRRRRRRRAHQRRPRPHRRAGRLAAPHRRGEGRAS